MKPSALTIKKHEAPSRLTTQLTTHSLFMPTPTKALATLPYPMI
jgi:hypothetical protein